MSTMSPEQHLELAQLTKELNVAMGSLGFDCEAILHLVSRAPNAVGQQPDR